ncbi:MAG: hypothetical protein WEB04_02265 [Dehalococcoidia bacterium]
MVERDVTELSDAHDPSSRPYLGDGVNSLGFLIGVLGLFIACFAIYWPIRDTFFILDDFAWFNAASNDSTQDYFRRAFSFPDHTPFEQATPFWRPFIDLYFFVGWRVFELDPTPWHVTNIVIHSLNAILLAILIAQLTRSRVTGILAALLFTALPTYDLAVSWISSATELLAATFYLLTLVCYASFLTSDRPRDRRAYYIAAFAALLFALLTKESTMSTVLALGIVTFVVGQSRATMRDFFRQVWALAPFAVLTGAYVLFLYVNEYRAGEGAGLYKLGWHAFANGWHYVRWMCFPYMQQESWADGIRTIGAGAFLVITATSLLSRNRLVAGLCALSVVALSPYVFFEGVISPRYTYVASGFFSGLVVVIVVHAATRVAPRSVPVRWAITVAAVAFLTALAATQARDRQLGIENQAFLYGNLFHEVPALCGELPPRSSIYILDSPVRDTNGNRKRAAMNVAYDDVYVPRVGAAGLPAGAADAEHVCIVEYRSDTRHYHRVE